MSHGRGGLSMSICRDKGKYPFRHLPFLNQSSKKTDASTSLMLYSSYLTRIPSLPIALNFQITL